MLVLVLGLIVLFLTLLSLLSFFTSIIFGTNTSTICTTVIVIVAERLDRATGAHATNQEVYHAGPLRSGCL